jgi:hypothetical protein
MLPAEPSEKLRLLLAAIKRRGSSQPTRVNPLHLHAPGVFVTPVCVRHRFETNDLPRAKEQGWPDTIDFDALPQRVRALAEPLGTILTNPETSKCFVKFRKVVKQYGTRRLSGIMGTYTFGHDSQPG